MAFKKWGSLFNLCNVYIGIWLLYNFHWNAVGFLFPIINSFSNVFLAINLAISFYATIVVLQNNKLNTFFQYTLFLILLFILYGMFSVVQGSHVFKANTGGTIKSGTYMIGALRTFLPLFTFFLFSKMGYVTEKTMRRWFWVFLSQTILVYFAYRTALGLDSMDELRTNNRGYLFVSIFPYVFLFKKYPIIQYVLIILFLLVALLSLKRGAILITSLGAIYFIWMQMSHASAKKKGLALIVLFVMLVYGSQFVERLYENNIVVQHRFDNTMDGHMSGRDVIAANLLDIYSSSDMLHIVFGFGADGTLRYGNYAHNDWLEMLFDQGLLGFTAFFLFWLSFYRLWRRENRYNTEIAFLLGLLFICNFPKTFFSMWYSMTNMFVTMPLGYCLAVIEKNSKAKHVKYNND